MNVDMKELLVNDEEFKLLSEMILDIEDPEYISQKLEYEITGSNGKDALLFQLGLADDLKVIANYGNHHLIFPVQMKMDDFSNFKMSLKPAKIFEKGKQLRSWRLPVDKTVYLVNEQGEELHYQIKDLSASGISIWVDDEKGSIFPEQLHNIYLQLPNRDRLAISGVKTRRVDHKTVAYSLGESIDDAVLDNLSEYLFECHAEQHSAVYASQFT